MENLFCDLLRSRLVGQLSAAPRWRSHYTAWCESLQVVGAAVQLALEGLEIWSVVRFGAPTF